LVSQPTWTPEPVLQAQRIGAESTSEITQAAGATPAPDDGTSEMDVLRQKAQKWRALYRPIADRIARLEAEIPKLEADHSRTLSITVFDGPRNSTRTGAERTRDRLTSAQNELAQARRDLAQIEDAARRDGVASGQLY
jgi:hypothetical protein